MVNRVYDFQAILRQQQNDNNFRTLDWFPAMERGQSQNSYKLFVWQNQGNFMQSVINMQIVEIA